MPRDTPVLTRNARRFPRPRAAPVESAGGAVTGRARPDRLQWLRSGFTGPGVEPPAGVVRGRRRVAARHRAAGRCPAVPSRGPGSGVLCSRRGLSAARPGWGCLPLTRRPQQSFAIRSCRVRSEAIGTPWETAARSPRGPDPHSNGVGIRAGRDEHGWSAGRRGLRARECTHAHRPGRPAPATAPDNGSAGRVVREGIVPGPLHAREVTLRRICGARPG